MLKDKIILIAINKPKGFICTHKDDLNRKKAIDLIPKKTFQTIKGKIHYVGRLDYNSQGLLLLTNNGCCLINLYTCSKRSGCLGTRINRAFGICFSNDWTCLLPSESFCRLCREV